MIPLAGSKLTPKQMPQTPRRHLHRGAARTTTGRVHLGLVGSPCAFSVDEGSSTELEHPILSWVETASAAKVADLLHEIRIECRN